MAKIIVIVVDEFSQCAGLLFYAALSLITCQALGKFVDDYHSARDAPVDDIAKISFLILSASHSFPGDPPPLVIL